MSWFPTGRNDSPGWRLDIVSLLAVIGDSTISEQSQLLTSSPLCLLPRLIPAPQALLKSARPTRLPATPAIVVGVSSGARVEELNFYAELIHRVRELEQFEFREYEIKRAPKGQAKKDVEQNRRETDSRTARSSTKNSKVSLEIDPSLVRARYFSPLGALTVLSTLLTIGLIAWACLIADGVAVLALCLMSLASMLVGSGLWWAPRLSMRPSDAEVPDGDILIRTRKGAFVVVHCSEEIARELYIGVEEVRYRVGDTLFKLLVGVGTVALMVGVVLLGNCSWTMQASIGATYVFLNGAYWLVALLPETWFWNISLYDVKETTPKHLRDVHKRSPDGTKPSLTRTMWCAIQCTKDTVWIDTSGAAPRTPAWVEWARLASENRGDRGWDAVGEKDRLMKRAKGRWGDEKGAVFGGGEGGFEAANKAPVSVPGAAAAGGGRVGSW
jgi:hypothetical protein